MVVPIAHVSTVNYMQGTRRAEELISNIRQMSYSEEYSFTQGWNDNVLVEIMNLGLDKLYHTLTLVDSPPNIQEVVMDVFSQQQAYDIPIYVHMALRIIDVRYLWGNEPWAYVTLGQGMIQDRFAYPSNIPDTYCIRDGQILLSPTPNLTRPNSLIINYQKRMRKIDVRRGAVASINSNRGVIANISNTSPCEITSFTPHNMVTGNKVSIQGALGETEVNSHVYTITVTGGTTFTLNGVDATNFGIYAGGGFWFQAPMSFLLDFTVTSEKDVNMQPNANSLLDRIDWACFTDRNGRPVVDGLPLNGYNTDTRILTIDQNYCIDADGLAQFLALQGNQDPIYVVQGDYSSSHSELDRMCEDLLIEFGILRLLRLQSAAEPTRDQYDAEQAIMTRLMNSYRRYRPSIMGVIFKDRRRSRSFPLGVRGIV